MSPYNFILNPEVQKSIGLDLKDKIIAFDEAHNLETVAEDVYSSELEVSDLLYTINNIKLKPGNKTFKAYLRKLSSLKEDEILYGMEMIKGIETSKFNVKLSK